MSSPSAPFDRSQSRIFPASISKRKSKLERVCPMTARRIGFVMNLLTLFKTGAIASSRKRSFCRRRRGRVRERPSC